MVQLARLPESRREAPRCDRGLRRNLPGNEYGLASPGRGVRHAESRSCSGTLGLTGRLAGLPVLEITTSWAGPICGCLLGDLGGRRREGRTHVRLQADAGQVKAGCYPIAAVHSVESLGRHLKMARFRHSNGTINGPRRASGTGSARPGPPYLGAWGRRAPRECHR